MKLKFEHKIFNSDLDFRQYLNEKGKLKDKLGI
jgi:hypothetical protein